jgi:hypothetical protein
VRRSTNARRLTCTAAAAADTVVSGVEPFEWRAKAQEGWVLLDVRPPEGE